MPTNPPIVAFVTNVVPIYRFPIFAALAGAHDLRLRIFVTIPLGVSCREAVETLPLKHSASFNLLRTTRHGASGATQREPFAIPLTLAFDLIRCRPSVVVAGDFGIRSLVCWVMARLLGSRFVLSSEEIATSAAGRSALQLRLRRFLIARADAFLAWGGPAHNYLRSMNVGSRRIFECAQAVDNELWFDRARRLDRRRERTLFGVQGTVFLLVGRALPRKGFQNFLRAWQRIPSRIHPAISAVIVGDGDCLAELESYAEAHGLANVHFAGARAPDEVAHYYAAADVFVFPSLEDVWGLVVNEAMCFGLPVMGSKFAGAPQTLLAGSDRGVTFNPADIDEFAGLLVDWAIAPPPRDVEACRRIVDTLTFGKSIAAIQEMIVATTRPVADG